MDQVFRLNDAGDVVREVVSLEKVERAHLLGAVEDAQTVLVKTEEALAAAREQVTTLETQASDQESALADAKSGLETYDQLKPAAELGEDDGGSEEASDGVEEQEVGGSDAGDAPEPAGATLVEDGEGATATEAPAAEEAEIDPDEVVGDPEIEAEIQAKTAEAQAPAKEDGKPVKVRLSKEDLDARF